MAACQKELKKYSFFSSTLILLELLCHEDQVKYGDFNSLKCATMRNAFNFSGIFEKSVNKYIYSVS